MAIMGPSGKMKGASAGKNSKSDDGGMMVASGFPAWSVRRMRRPYWKGQRDEQDGVRQFAGRRTNFGV